MKPSIWCDRHWARVNADAAATTLLTRRIVEHPAFTEACGAAPATCSTDALEAAIERLSPVCCVLGDNVIATLLDADDPVSRFVRAVTRSAGGVR